jgi:hypothetical protein
MQINFTSKFVLSALANNTKYSVAHITTRRYVAAASRSSRRALLREPRRQGVELAKT